MNYSIVSKDTIKIGERIIALPMSIGRSPGKIPKINETGNILYDEYYVEEVDGLIYVCFYPATDEEENKYVEYLKSHPESDGDSTIWAFDLAGNKVWEIEPSPRGKQLNRSAAFSAFLFKGDEMWAYSIEGLNYLVDKKTGKLLRYVETR